MLIQRRGLNANFLIAHSLLLGAMQAVPAAMAQNQPVVNELGMRRVFVAECMGPKSDTASLAFCTCSFSKLISRYGLVSYSEQDAIVRASNAKDLIKLARLAWEPEFASCRSK